MNLSLYSGATGMQAQQLNLNVISNNIANVNTTGYKKNKIEFQDLLYQTVRTAGTSAAQGALVPVEIQIGYGTRVVATQRIFDQGQVTATNNTLDLAIENEGINGDGFFRISLPDGTTTAYSRDGAFKLSSEGQMVTSDGFALDPPVTIPEGAVSVSVSADGNIEVLQAGETQATGVGQIQLTKFINPAGLRSIGRNLFLETEASGPPIDGDPNTEGFGRISQGFLELSNVDVVEELVNMIMAQRTYEVNARAIRTSDEMMRETNNIVN
ncbi:MAG TPA: flagellar basal-body rod protein FlgG [Candidatus Latescibacteria bacterium]|nr:flagellar basal-body rod protein FlgG [Candidatus Latescibacterota bacterium]